MNEKNQLPAQSHVEPKQVKFTTDCVIVGTGPAGGSLGAFFGSMGEQNHVEEERNHAILITCRSAWHHYRHDFDYC